MGVWDQDEDNSTENTRLMLDTEEEQAPSETMSAEVLAPPSDDASNDRRPIQAEGSNNPSYGTSVNAEVRGTSVQRRVRMTAFSVYNHIQLISPWLYDL